MCVIMSDVLDRSTVLDRISYWHPLDVDFEAYVQENMMWVSTEDDKGQCVWLDRFEYPTLTHRSLDEYAERVDQSMWELWVQLTEPDLFNHECVRFILDIGPRDAVGYEKTLYLAPRAAPLGDPTLIKRLDFTRWKRVIWQYWDVVMEGRDWDKRILKAWYSLCFTSPKVVSVDLAYILEYPEEQEGYCDAQAQSWGDLSWARAPYQRRA